MAQTQLAEKIAVPFLSLPFMIQYYMIAFIIFNITASFTDLWTQEGARARSLIHQLLREDNGSPSG